MLRLNVTIKRQLTQIPCSGLNAQIQKTTQCCFSLYKVSDKHRLFLSRSEQCDTDDIAQKETQFLSLFFKWTPHETQCKRVNLDKTEKTGNNVNTKNI